MVAPDFLRQKFNDGFTYDGFLNHVSSLLVENKTTGPNQSEAMVHYTVMAEKRMHRWNKVLKFTEEQIRSIQSVDHDLKFLAITEAWCGDASHLVPVFNKIAVTNPQFEYRLVLRDEHPDLMEHYLTNGAKSIPILIVINEHFEEIFRFGPRPKPMQKRVLDYKVKQDKPFQEFLQETQVWYNKDKGQTTMKEFMEEFDKLFVKDLG